MADYIQGAKLAQAIRTLHGRDSNLRHDVLIRTRLALEKMRSSLDTYFPTIFSIHGLDILEALDKADLSSSEKTLLFKAFNNMVDRLGKELTVLEESKLRLILDKYQSFISRYNDAIEEDNNTILASNATKLNNDISKFSTWLQDKNKRPYLIYYIKGTDNSLASIKIATHSFSRARSFISNELTKELIKEAGNIKLSKDFKDIFNWGHALVDIGIEQVLSTPKTITSMVSMLPELLTQDSANILVTDFIETTGQSFTKIKLHQGPVTRGSTNTLVLAISSGIFQSALVQSTKFNNTQSLAEKSWNIKDLFKRVPSFASSLGLSANTTAEEFISKLMKVRASPSFKERIYTQILDALKGKDTSIPGSSLTILDSVNNFIKVQSNIKVPSIKKDLKPAQLRNLRGHFTSLASLQTLLNQALSEQIRKNMGTGNETRILNYRTGRFASSAKVEKMSQSREGMLTAFYTYMKYPYATFSEGGLQQNPRSRDPKLLISKSIREIGASLVKNRMRAVSL